MHPSKISALLLSLPIERRRSLLQRRRSLAKGAIRRRIARTVELSTIMSDEKLKAKAQDTAYPTHNALSISSDVLEF